MKKSKKALLFLTVCLVALVVAVSLAACNKNQHTHTWGNWTVTEENKPTAEATGKATRVCSGEGECDASATDKEYVLPALTSEDYQTAVTTPATCSAQGVTTYTYNKNGVNVSFDVATPIDPAAHKYNYVDLGAQGHKGICEYNADHTTEVALHNTDGEGGSCSVCGHTVITMGTAVTVSDASSFSPKRYFISLGAGEYELLIDGNAVDTNVAGCVAIIGTLNADYTIASVKTGTNRTVNLEAGDYFVEVYVGGTLEVDVWANHQHAFTETWSHSETHHWHAPICVHENIAFEDCDGYAEHSFSAWSDFDEQGKQHRSCMCGQTEERALGTPSEPDELLIGADKVNNAWLKVGVRSAYFFKLESATEGKYLIKAVNATVADAIIELYSSLEVVDGNVTKDADAVAKNALVVNLEANTPVYIAVKGNDLNSYKLTVTDSTDKGISSTDPAELVSGPVYDGYYYTAYTAKKGGIVTITFNKDEGSAALRIYQWSDGTYSRDTGADLLGNGTDTYSFIASEGETYYIQTFKGTGGTSLMGNVDVSFAPYNSHQYTITLSDGENTINNATVSLVYNGGEITTVTNNGNGTYTFANVDSSKDYTVKVSGLGNYGYYSNEAVIGRNVDTETAFSLTVHEKQAYKVNVVLPTGNTLPEGATLEGIQVSIGTSLSEILIERDASGSDASQSVYTTTTGADGIATFNVLAPKGGNYVVYVTVPAGHSLYGKFAYFSTRIKWTNNECQAMLTAVNEYTVTLTSGDGSQAPASVTVNDESVIDGKVLLPADFTEVTSISADGYSFSDIQVNAETKTITATYTDTKITLGTPKAFENVGYDGVIFTLVVEESGMYNFTFNSELEGNGNSDRLAYSAVYRDAACMEDPVSYDMDVKSCELEAGTYYVLITSNKMDLNWNYEPVSGTITVTKAAQEA